MVDVESLRYGRRTSEPAVNNSEEDIIQGAAWRSGLHVWLVMWRSWVRAPIKGPRCFLEQETLPLLLSTGWLQERVRA